VVPARVCAAAAPIAGGVAVPSGVSDDFVSQLRVRPEQANDKQKKRGKDEQPCVAKIKKSPARV